MRPLLRLSLLSAVCAHFACGGVGAPDDTTAPLTGGTTAPIDEDGELCIQVVRYARPASGGTCVLFPTPCHVPQDFIVCCDNHSFGACLGPNVQCVDDPRDTCEPLKGGTNCQGLCQPVQ